jgi:hypothetical protein
VAALPLASIAWWDEKHAQCVLGPLNKHSWTYPIGPDGRYLPEDEGGKYFEPPKVTVPKFSEAARFAFGVMMKHSAGGRGFAGVRMGPFEYTGQKMLGIAAYEKAVGEEVNKTYKKKGGLWAKVREPTDEEEADERYAKGGKYFLKHGDTWRDEVDRFLKIVSVQRLVDHIVVEGDETFAGTPYADSWVIGHDALSQFTEKGAQEYLTRRGFGPDRLLGPRGSTNEGTRYERRAVGDSPELMPLDTNLLSDLV